MVVSNLPLRNEDGQIVSGKLKADQDGFAPDAPLANVELPAAADDAVAYAPTSRTRLEALSEPRVFTGSHFDAKTVLA